MNNTIEKMTNYKHKNFIQLSEKINSVFLPIVERVSLLDDCSFSFDVNNFYKLYNNEPVC